jgi:hypothetical protein
MQTTVRTTIRIDKDLLNQARLLALSKGVSLQSVINETLAIGYKHVSDMPMQKNALQTIDNFRHKIRTKHVDVSQLLTESKSDQQ